MPIRSLLPLRRTVAAPVAALLAGAALIAPATVSAAPLPADTTAIVSGTPDLLGLLATPVNDSYSSHQSVSGDGTKVVFSSTADGMFAGDDDRVENVYVKDTTTGAVQLVSRATGADGEPTHRSCQFPVISQDGNAVAFQCDGPLDPADTNTRTDVYERNLTTQQTILVSRVSGLGAVGERGSYYPTIDKTGAHVAFTSEARNLSTDIPATSTGQYVFRRTIGAGDATTLVSRATGATGALGPHSSNASIDGSGNLVAFDSYDALDPADTNNRSDVYVRDVANGTTTLVSRADGPAGKVGNNDSYGPQISGNGALVAFSSQATNFDFAHDNTLDTDVYRRSLSGAATQLIDITLNGDKATGGALLNSIDETGEIVAYQSNANNLVADKTSNDGSAVYVNDHSSTALVSRIDGATGRPLRGAGSGALSADGSKVTFRVYSGDTLPGLEPRAIGVAIRNRTTGTTRPVSRPAGTDPFVNQGGASDDSSVSADGRFVAFVSSARGLGVPDPADTAVIVRDTVTGATTVVSRDDGGAVMAGVRVRYPLISGDGRRVMFTVDHGEDTDASVYVRDIPGARTYLISRADGFDGAPANGTSFGSSISDDGTRAVFTSRATNLGDGDTDVQDDVHLREINTGRTILIDRADGINGAKANLESAGGVISGDGSRVAFQSYASNLGDGDTDIKSDVHVRTIATGTTQLADLIGPSTKANDHSGGPSISRDGNIVSFTSNATNFGLPTTAARVYVRNLSAQTLVLAGRADGPAGAPIENVIYNPKLSADGSSLAFVAFPATSIAPGAPADGGARVYQRDLASGQTRLISRSTGTDGAATLKYDDVGLGGITQDGSCVTFSSDGDVTVGTPGRSDYSQVYVRAVRPDCGRVAPTTGDTGGTTGAPRTDHPTDRTAPVLTNAKLSRTRLKARQGTVLRVDVSEAARLIITIESAHSGVRGGSKHKPTCKATKQRSTAKKACTAFVRDGSLQRTVQAGTAKVAFSGRLGSKRLAPGRHRMTIVARDAAGNISKPVTLRFTVVR